ncbi:hypothetical protein VUR80DRAFT_4758 [Thermomyces stellatus]
MIPLSPDEVKERLATFLELQGDTLDTFEEGLRLQGLTLQSVGSCLPDSPTTQPSSSSSPISTGSSAGSSPIRAIETAEADRSGTGFSADIIAEVPKQEPGSTADTTADSVAFMADLVIGEEAPRDMSFCPWRMVQHYPDWFIGKANTPRVSSLPSAFRLLL